MLNKASKSSDKKVSDHEYDFQWCLFRLFLIVKLSY